MPLTPVETAIRDLRAGRMIILVDDEDRENEGDLVLPAQFADQVNINFLAKNARGLICLALESSRCDFLQLPPMTSRNQSPRGTAFTVSIEAKEGISTGISAADRAHTIRLAAHPETQANAFVSPGHVFPLRAQDGGVLVRAGHTEGSVDLMRLSGLMPAAVICEVMNDDGTMARLPDLLKFAEKHGQMSVITIKDLISYRMQHETLVEEIAVTRLPTEFGEFTVHAFQTHDGTEHLALVKGPK